MVPDYIFKTEKTFPDLTTGLKKVADYLLDDPFIFAIHPAKQIGNIIGVSETMIIRFCNSIGYKGFSDLQIDVRKHIMTLNQDSIVNSLEDPIENNFSKSIQNDITLLQENIQKIDKEELEAIIETIIQSKKVIVAGYYQSFSLAYWLYFNLTYMIENAYLYRPEADFRLLDTTPKDSCIIVFTFYRYAVATIQFIKDAKEKGLKIIVITDSRVSPIVKYADHIILVHLKNTSSLSKGPVALSITNAIMHEMVNRVDQDLTGIRSKHSKYLIKDEDKE